MKLFALLLFSLEFMAPAMLVSIADSTGTGNQDKVQVMDGTRHQNILYSIFTEEITENEEGREGQKDIIFLTDFDFAVTFLQFQEREASPCKYTAHSSKQFDTQPALFKLNCTYLI